MHENNSKEPETKEERKNEQPKQVPKPKNDWHNLIQNYLKIICSWPLIVGVLIAILFIYYGDEVHTILKNLAEQKISKVNIGGVSFEASLPPIFRSSSPPVSEVAPSEKFPVDTGTIEAQQWDVKMAFPDLHTSERIEIVDGKQYTDTKVPVDFKWFINCQFKNVTFVYEGKGDFSFKNCLVIGQMKWSFKDEASNTLKALRIIYHAFEEKGNKIVEGAINYIQKGKDIRPKDTDSKK